MNFSVLMSIYIKEKASFLNECFESIWIKQCFKPNEIVVVLDGPITPDLSKVLVFWKSILNDVLKIIILEKNVGLGNALNIGLRNCSNEWVFRMDTDDICMPDRFEKQLAFIESNPDVVLFGGQVLEFENEPNDFQVLKSVPTTNEEIRLFSQKRCPFNHMTVAYKKSI
ncbi:MAG: glycosyltransferase, partial [Bacilli bacterium]